MHHLRLILACCLGIVGAGCNMCQAPYDYTGPTLAPNGQPIGGFGTRIGSVWADDSQPRTPPPQAPPLATAEESEEEEAPRENAPVAAATPEDELDDELDAALDDHATAASHAAPVNE